MSLAKLPTKMDKRVPYRILSLEGVTVLVFLLTNPSLIGIVYAQNITDIAPEATHDDVCICNCNCEPLIVVGDKYDDFCERNIDSCHKKIDLVFILDGSSSVGQENFRKVLVALANLAKTFNIDIATGMQVGFIVYSDVISQAFRLNQLQFAELIAIAIQGFSYPGGGTRTDLALKFAEDMFASDGRLDAYRIAMLITDGRSEAPSETIDNSQKLKLNQDVTIASFGITDEVRRSEIIQIASQPDMAFFSNTFDEFIEDLYTYMENICQKLDTTRYTDQRVIDVEWINGLDVCIPLDPDIKYKYHGNGTTTLSVGDGTTTTAGSGGGGGLGGGTTTTTTGGGGGSGGGGLGGGTTTSGSGGGSGGGTPTRGIPLEGPERTLSGGGIGGVSDVTTTPASPLEGPERPGAGARPGNDGLVAVGDGGAGGGDPSGDAGGGEGAGGDGGGSGGIGSGISTPGRPLEGIDMSLGGSGSGGNGVGSAGSGSIGNGIPPPIPLPVSQTPTPTTIVTTGSVYEGGAPPPIPLPGREAHTQPPIVTTGSGTGGGMPIPIPLPVTQAQTPPPPVSTGSAIDGIVAGGTGLGNGGSGQGSGNIPFPILLPDSPTPGSPATTRPRSSTGATIGGGGAGSADGGTGRGPENAGFGESSLVQSRSCLDLYDAGNRRSGMYAINPAGDSNQIVVQCDMETDGGGWTIIQRRINNVQSFIKRWTQYMFGFGEVTSSYWFGVTFIHQIVHDTSASHELRVDLMDWDDNEAYAHYGYFSIDGPENYYTLRIGGTFKGTAGDSLHDHNGRPFSVYDQQTDKDSARNCAAENLSGWWYLQDVPPCFTSDLNGPYTNCTSGDLSCDTSLATGIIWKTWRGSFYSLKATRMMIRRSRPRGSLVEGLREKT